MHSRNILLNCVALVAGMTVNIASDAADGDRRAAAREREQARRIQSLQQENGELKVKLKELEDRSEASTRAVGRARREAARISQEVVVSRKEIEELKSAHLAETAARAEKSALELSALKGRLDEMSARVAQRESEKRENDAVAAIRLQALGRQGTLIESCRDENARLHRFGTEMLEHFENEDKRTANRLIGVGQVNAFSVFQDYRDKLDKLKFEPPRLAQ